MNLSRLYIPILILIFSMSASAVTLPPDLDQAKAESFLAERPLTGPEGLWGFEPDEVLLMILSDDHTPGSYGIYVVDAVDCRLTPGMKIGALQSSIDAQTFRISLASRWKKGNLDLPLEGVAKLDEKSRILAIEGKGGKLSITPSIVLPNLLSLLRLRVRINFNDPASRLPTGLRRLYPLPSDLPDSPRYL